MRRWQATRRRGAAFLAVLVLSTSTPTVKLANAHTAPHPLSSLNPPKIALEDDITLSVGPTLLFNSGDWVTVAWTGIDEQMYPDGFIAAFSPGSALDNPSTITEVAPVKYQFIASGSPLPDGDERSIYDFAQTQLDKHRGDAGQYDERAAGGEGDRVEGGNAVRSLRFRLLNLRDAEGYRFGLFTGGPSNPVLVAKTEEAVTFARSYEVTNVHLALTDDPAAMRVSWVTGKASQAPVVRFRHISDEDSGRSVHGSRLSMVWNHSWQRSMGQTITYGRDDMCGAPASGKGFHDPGLLHSAVMSGLLPGQYYEYQIGDGELEEWSSSSFFSASPSSTSKFSAKQMVFGEASSWGPDAVKVAVFGDMGTAEVDGTLDAGHTAELPSIKTVGILKEHLRTGVAGTRGQLALLRGQGYGSGVGPDLGLVLHIGDLSYARGYDTQWDEFLDQIEPVASNVPWMIGVGNHERDYPDASRSSARKNMPYFTGTDSGGECGVPTAFRFIMPGEAGKPMADTPWYGFDFGPIHFTVMSTEHDFTPGSTQHAFLEEDLSRVDRSRTPWLVFTGHRPMYVNSGGPGASDCEDDDDNGSETTAEEHCSNDQPVAALLQSSLEPMLIKHQVDLGLYGHHHSFQRTCKVEGGVCKGISSGYPVTSRGRDVGISRSGGGYPLGNEGYVAPVHVVVGMAGMGLSQNMVEPRPEWVEYATDQEFGLGMIVANSTTLKLSFILDSDDRVGDEMWLTRSPSQDGTHHRTEMEKDLAKKLKRGQALRSKRGRA